jgi:hypothetical protein
MQARARRLALFLAPVLVARGIVTGFANDYRRLKRKAIPLPEGT